MAKPDRIELVAPIVLKFDRVHIGLFYHDTPPRPCYVLVTFSKHWCEGRKPYGYYEGESAAMDRLKALRAEGLGFDRVAARMNEEHVPTRTGKPWHGVVVNRILTGKR